MDLSSDRRYRPVVNKEFSYSCFYIKAEKKSRTFWSHLVIFRVKSLVVADLHFTLH